MAKKASPPSRSSLGNAGQRSEAVSARAGDSPGNSPPATTFRFRDQRLVRREFLLVVQRPLLELIERHLHSPPWSNDARQLEFESANRCQSSHDAVGFWDGIPLTNSALRPPTPFLEVTEVAAREMGWEWNQAEIDQRLKRGEIRLRYFAQVAIAYAGWLVTNRAFQQEQAALLTAWSDQIKQAGLSGVGTLLSMSGPSPTAGISTTDRGQQFALHVRQFLVRWRLNELTAPNLPAPAKPLMAGLFPLTVSHHLMEMGGVFHIPDTYPIPSRDELRGMLDDALHYSTDAEHLEEWSRIVRASNPAKNKIERFARLRQVYHYWALLHDRHAEALVGQVGTLQKAFAEFFRNERRITSAFGFRSRQGQCN